MGFTTSLPIWDLSLIPSLVSTESIMISDICPQIADGQPLASNHEIDAGQNLGLTLLKLNAKDEQKRLTNGRKKAGYAETQFTEDCSGNGTVNQQFSSPHFLPAPSNSLIGNNAT